MLVLGVAILVAIGLGLGAGWTLVLGGRAPRNRLIESYRLVDDDWTRKIIDSFVRTVSRAQGAGIAVGVLVFAFLPRDIGIRGANGFEVAGGFAALYCGLLVGTAVGVALALRRSLAAGQVRRASLAPRDARRFVPRYFVGAAIAFAAAAVALGMVAITLGTLSAGGRVVIGVAMALAVVAASVVVPLANRLAAIPTRADTDAHETVEQVLRGAAVRAASGATIAFTIMSVGIIVSVMMHASSGFPWVAFACYFVAAAAEAYTRTGAKVPGYFTRIFTPQEVVA